MPFEIPDNLHPDCAPLARLLLSSAEDQVHPDRYALLVPAWARLARRRVLLIWLEDGAWSPDSLGLLRWLLDHAVSLPILVVDGMPVGVQLMGLPDRDAALCAVAAWIDGSFSG